ncbi:MAG: helix-turn-helix transcriptional regulator [Halioglobus sp.]
MIIRKLRQQRQWSQEQLAQMSGLGLRTVQRIEAGNRASLESLRSLAAVFECEVETLEQQIVLIDKESAQWQKAPRWIRAMFIGSNTVTFRRQDAVVFEIGLMVCAVALLLVGLVVGDEFKATILSRMACLFALSAYYMSVKLRLGDKYHVW